MERIRVQDWWFHYLFALKNTINSIANWWIYFPFRQFCKRRSVYQNPIYQRFKLAADTRKLLQHLPQYPNQANTLYVGVEDQFGGGYSKTKHNQWVMQSSKSCLFTDFLEEMLVEEKRFWMTRSWKCGEGSLLWKIAFCDLTCAGNLQ